VAPQRRLSLSTFYGEDDDATLQNVLHHVPNIVPQPLRNVSITGDNDANVAKASIGTIQPCQSKLQSISEDSLLADNSCAASVANVRVAVEPDSDGAYANPILTDSPNPDSVEVVRHSVLVDDNGSRKQLVRQDCNVVDDDDDDDRCTKCPDSVQFNHGLPTSLSRKDVLTLNKSTLRTFLKRVSTQSTECVDRLESRDTCTLDDEQTEVFNPVFLVLFAFSTLCLRKTWIGKFDDSSVKA